MPAPARLSAALLAAFARGPAQALALAGDGAIQLASDAFAALFPERSPLAGATLDGLLGAEALATLRAGRTVTTTRAGGMGTRFTAATLDDGLLLVTADGDDAAFRDRLLTLGLVSAGLAHDLNTPLQVVTISLDLACRGWDRPAQRAEVATLLDDARTSVRQIETLVGDLRRLVGGVDSDLVEMVDLATVVDATERLVRGSLATRGAQLVTTREPDLPRLWANPRHVVQVLVNLIGNAADALVVPAGTVGLDLRRHGERLRITVGERNTEDSEGRALTPAKLRRLSSSGGMGLGLAIVDRIVTGYGGTVRLVGREPAPLTVQVELPLPAGMPHAAGAAP